MSRKPDLSKAILSINPDANFFVDWQKNDTVETCSLVWKEGTPEISRADIQTKLTELEAEYDANEYQRKRKAEYPTIEELVVALYDTDDKAAIDAKRAEVKAKYPK